MAPGRRRRRLLSAPPLDRLSASALTALPGTTLPRHLSRCLHLRRALPSASPRRHVHSLLYTLAPASPSIRTTPPPPRILPALPPPRLLSEPPSSQFPSSILPTGGRGRGQDLSEDEGDRAHPQHHASVGFSLTTVQRSMVLSSPASAQAAGVAVDIYGRHTEGARGIASKRRSFMNPGVAPGLHSCAAPQPRIENGNRVNSGRAGDQFDPRV